MKKLNFVILILLITGSMAYAQSIERRTEVVLPNSLVGVEGGYNFAKIDADLGSNTVRRRAFWAGIFYQRYLSPSFAIQPTLQYSSEGWINEEDTGDREAQLQFINLTTVGKFYPAGGLNLQGGIQTALLVDATEEGGVSPLALDEYMKRFNFSAVFGVGYDFGFGLRLGGRYVQGLININDGINVGSNNNEIKTSNFQVYIGYGFKLPSSNYGHVD